MHTKNSDFMSLSFLARVLDSMTYSLLTFNYISIKIYNMKKRKRYYNNYCCYDNNII